MADEGMRRLERLAGAGDPEAQARYLRERVRLGELPAERLGLLALLGDPLAARALGREPPEAPLPPKEWARQLEPLGPEVLVRVAVGLARAVQRREEAYSLRAIRAAEAWALSPDSARAFAAGQAADAIAARRWAIDDRLHASVEAAEAAARVAQFATLPVGPPFPPHMDAPHWLGICAASALRAAPGPGAEETHARLREEVFPWALGQGDPIALRRRGTSGIEDASVEGAPIL
jgi:hypothetical protein